MAHDLRAPLAVIMSYADLLGNRQALRLPDSKQDECLEVIVRNGRTLLRLIEGLGLNGAARGERTAPSLPRERTDLGEVLGRAAAAWKRRAADRKIELVTGESASIMIRGGEEAIAEMLERLALGALEMTTGGERVELKVRADDTLAVIDVTVSGTCLPQDRLEQIHASRDGNPSEATAEDHATAAGESP